MPDTKPNLYQKIAQITEAIGIIGKDANAPQQMGGYAFTSHGMVIGHLRHELTSRNVVIRPSGEELLRFEVTEKKTTVMQGNVPVEKVSFTYHSVIKYRFTVIDGDDPSVFFDDFWIGEGMDNGDKGIQKAGTSAEKYYLMKLFKMGDKDDPDGIDTDGTTRTESQSATLTKPAAAKPPTPYVPPSPPTTASAPPEPKNQLEQLVLDAGLNGAKPDPDQKDVSPETYKNQIEALVWFGEQLPSSMGWFRGKIVPMVSLWETRSKAGKLTAENGLNSPSGIDWIFDQLKAAHVTNCGSANCEHLTAAKIAVLVGGRIVDPAK